MLIEVENCSNVILFLQKALNYLGVKGYGVCSSLSKNSIFKERDNWWKHMRQNVNVNN